MDNHKTRCLLDLHFVKFVFIFKTNIVDIDECIKYHDTL